MRSASKKPRMDLNDEITPEGGYQVRTYRPTLEEMKNFSAYVKHIHDTGGHKAGLAKIIPPAGYAPRKAGYNDDELFDREIPSPIKQSVNGDRGLFQQLNIVERRKMTVRSFKKLAEEKHPTPEHETDGDLERIFWKNVFLQPSIYGADVSGSLYDDDIEEFNLTRLNTILDDINQDYGVTIQGVNTAYLYFGMWKTSFCWHTEDVDLYSINYLHDGAPKAWYTISPEHGKRFERLAASFFPHSFKTCKAFLRHKTTLISPAVLKKFSIPFSKCVQRKGEFMITFPYSYHSGFNHGYNIAEATNFALEYWIEFGKWATRCECSSESVRISMQTFVKRYQSDRYEKWLQGKDICEDPRDRRHKAAAPKPTDYDLYLMGSHVKPEEDCNQHMQSNALQQNQSGNVKIKTKAARKAYPNVADTYQRFSSFPYKVKCEPDSEKHYSPTPEAMVEVDYLSDEIQTAANRQYNYKAKHLDIHTGGGHEDFSRELDQQIATFPNHNRELKEWQKKRRKEGKSGKDAKEPKKPKKEKKPKEPMLPSKDLLQFLPLTFTHEKRFNRCIAAQPPHCSVCQLLELHPKDNEEIWGEFDRKKSNDPISNSLDSKPTCQEQANPSDNSKACELPASQSPLVTVSAGKQVEDFRLPESAPVLLPRGVFNPDSDTPKVEVDAIDGSSPLKEGDSGYIADDNRLDFLDLNLESSELLQCSVCMLCVHRVCYGLDRLQSDRADWICDRCLQKNTRSVINCELCPCRGGALKELGKNIWIHLICALTVPNMKFIDLIKPDKSLANQVKLPDNQDKNPSCEYCTPNPALSKYVQGRCISCVGYFHKKDSTWYTCSKTFHPTCGHRNGAKFSFFDAQLDPDSKTLIRAVCADCRKMAFGSDNDIERDDSEKEESLDPIEVDTQVVARASNGNFYDGYVELRQIVTYHEVFFPSSSEFQGNITSKRIVGFDPSRVYNVGDTMEVRDGKEGIRTGKFKGLSKVEEYTIRFVVEGQQPGRVEREKVRRHNIYLNLDQLPENLMRTRYKGAFCRDNTTASCIDEANQEDTDNAESSQETLQSTD